MATQRIYNYGLIIKEYVENPEQSRQRNYVEHLYSFRKYFPLVPLEESLKKVDGEISETP